MKRFVVAACVAAVALLWFALGADRYLSLDALRAQAAAEPLLAGLTFFAGYLLMAALSIPGAALLTLAAGALFGFGWGLLLVSFASSLGAVLACALARTLLRDWVQRRFASQLQRVNRGLEKDGVFYLLSLRLIPAVPFFIVNLVFGLTRMRLWTFYWVSQLGMLAGTAVYVNAGVQLGRVESLSLTGIMTPSLLGAFTLLAAFPWLVKALVGIVQRRKIYRAYRRPKKFDTNLLVIGGGSAGLVSAYMAAATKAKVTLVEEHKMGGDCLNTGCVPSKALIKSAEVAYKVRQAAEFGVQTSDPQVDFSAVMARVRAVIAKIEPHDSISRYTELGVDCEQGRAHLLDPWRVKIIAESDEKIVTAKKIIIATGAAPMVPEICGIDSIDYLTSDNLWQLQVLPQKLLVLGGGPIGCELAQAFARLGSKVTIVDRSAHLLPREDVEVSELIEQQFLREGICLKLNVDTKFVDAQALHLNSGETIEFDRLLVAVGRRANVSGFGLETLKLELTARGTLAVDEYLRTSVPNIFACGDVCGPYQFTHMASHQAWYACVNALFGGIKKFAVDYSVVPWATFTAPEVARVGLSEAEARMQGIDYELTRYQLDDLDRAICDGSNRGFVKVLSARGSDKILGATVVGSRASDLIGEFIAAMKHGYGLNKILGTIHIYPTLSEANKFVAGNWKRTHAPEKILKWLKRWHQWRLG